MKKDIGKIWTNKLLRNGIKGFILAIIPVVIINIETIILKKFYYFDVISSMIFEIVKYGLLGIIISVVYTYFSKRYPKISKYVALATVIAYYIFALVFFILVIYFDKIGPLFG